MSSSDTDKLLKKVLKTIKPDQEAVLKKVDIFLKKVNSEIKKNKMQATAMVGGSIAKDTNLHGDHDCDVFIKFNYERYKDKDLSKLLKKILVSFKPTLIHGSRDYFQIDNEINLEIVPVLDIVKPEDAVNVTDMSPLHVSWVNDHPKMKDEIRLSKQFCKSIGVYGAESYIKGFSGHVLDILTIHYRGFIPLLRASARWKMKTVVDPENYFKGAALKKLNRSKIDSALIVIDPVLPDRNASAALAEEKFDMFRKAAKEFLKDPDPDYFVIKTVTPEYLQEKYKTDLILMNATPLKGKVDVVGAKLLKAFTCIANRLNFYDFGIRTSGWYWDKKGDALFWFRTKKQKVLPLTKHVGPPLKTKDNVADFKKKYSKTFIEKNRICTYVPRQYTEVVDLVKDILKDGVFNDKVKRLVLVKKKTRPVAKR